MTKMHGISEWMIAVRDIFVAAYAKHEAVRPKKRAWRC
jgi:hypothetical protein